METTDKKPSVIPKGSTVKFANPLPDESPDQRFIVIEADEVRPLVQALNTGLNIPPTYRYPASTWEVVK